MIAVRHGETEWNILGKHQGHLDSALTERGIRQAHAIAAGLQEFSIDEFYSSDLGRAVQTAEIISQNIGKKFVTDPRLREQSLGILQGFTRAEFQSGYPDEYGKFVSRDPDYAIPGGESIREKFLRCTGCIEELSKQHQGKSILVVTHGGVLISCFQKTLNIPITQRRTYSLFNGSINVFTLSETQEWRLEIWGGMHHMRLQHLPAIDDF
jgi:2,3-bisphosphoglycerate-dependent phosphoglycerate mutase